MSSLPKWNDTYKVGNVLLDEQHKRLLEISGKAYQLLTSTPVCAEEFHDLLNSFVETQREHFAAEERTLARNGYPNLAAHIAEHDRFRAMLAELQCSADVAANGRAELLRVMVEFIGNHILLTDMACKDYLKDR